MRHLLAKYVLHMHCSSLCMLQTQLSSDKLSHGTCEHLLGRAGTRSRGPAAKEALNHKWLSGGTSAERAKGKPLQETVVQRIQVGIYAESYMKRPLPILWSYVTFCTLYT